MQYVGDFLSISTSRRLDEQKLHAAVTAIQGVVWLDWTGFCNLAVTFLHNNLAIPCVIEWWAPNHRSGQDLTCPFSGLLPRASLRRNDQNAVVHITEEMDSHLMIHPYFDVGSQTRELYWPDSLAC